MSWPEYDPPNLASARRCYNCGDSRAIATSAGPTARSEPTSAHVDLCVG
jgi:hypothetical protein